MFVNVQTLGTFQSTMIRLKRELGRKNQECYWNSGPEIGYHAHAQNLQCEGRTEVRGGKNPKTINQSKKIQTIFKNSTWKSARKIAGLEWNSAPACIFTK